MTARPRLPWFSVNTAINNVSGMTLEEITFILQRYPSLQEIGEPALLFEKKYGVNAYFILGVASQESGFGTSLLAGRKNNLFGLGAFDVNSFESALTFSTKSDSVEYFCVLIARYQEDGRNTPASINKRYATDETWASRVVSLMNSYASQVNNKRESLGAG